MNANDPQPNLAASTSTQSDLRQYWYDAVPYTRFVENAGKNCGLWEGVYDTARVPDWAVEKACDRARDGRLLVIAEDWCGDASNTVPILARLGDQAQCLEMRVIGRDVHPELMNRFLTNGTRSIPVTIALDSEFRALGHWGPRPTELQAWVRENKDTMPRDERYRYVRRWYAKDRGATTLREVLALFD